MNNVNSVIAPTPYTTFYDTRYTAELKAHWQKGHPGVESQYFNTHAGRFALLVEILRRLEVKGACLDVAGTRMTRSLFVELTGLTSCELSPDVDVEIDSWADQVGLAKHDAVILTEVIEHLNANPALTLHEVNRCLVPGGYLVMTTVNVGSELGLFNLAHGEAPYAMANIFGKRGDRHQREYAPRELQRLVAAHGFNTYMFTANIYQAATIKHKAHRWVQERFGNGNAEIYGDTIFIIGQKVTNSDKPRWLHPIYHHSISENRCGEVPSDVQARLRTGYHPALDSLFYRRHRT